MIFGLMVICLGVLLKVTACPMCGEKTCSKTLKNCKKECFMGHRKYLDRDHAFRRQKKAFNGEPEFGEAPKPLTN